MQYIIPLKNWYPIQTSEWKTYLFDYWSDWEKEMKAYFFESWYKQTFTKWIIELKEIDLKNYYIFNKI